MHNFGKIKNAFNEYLIEGIGKKDNVRNSVFKKYLRTIRESEILKTQFLVYDNIERRVDESIEGSIHFINENLSLLQKYKPSEIIKENKKLLGIAKEVDGKLDTPYELSGLHESLATLVCTRKTASNIDMLSEKIGQVRMHINSNKPKEAVTEAVDLPMGMFSSLLVDKFNDKYSSLDENDRDILKSLLDSTTENKPTIYKNTIKECLSLVNEKLVGSDLETKDRLLKAKEMLLNLNESEATGDEFIQKISRLMQLKGALKSY